MWTDRHPGLTTFFHWQVVIKYVPYVADSKRALDEYTSEIMMGGRNTIVVHNTCEDSLLASPIILDLVILTEICQRITFRISEYQSSHVEKQGWWKYPWSFLTVALVWCKMSWCFHFCRSATLLLHYPLHDSVDYSIIHERGVQNIYCMSFLR